MQTLNVTVDRMTPVSDEGIDGNAGGESRRRGMPDASSKSATEDKVRHEMRRDESGSKMAVALLEKLRGLREGDVYLRTLETPDAFATVRLVQRASGGGAVVELASFAKLDFETWFWNEARGVAIEIDDRTLARRAQAQVKWLGKLQIEN